MSAATTSGQDLLDALVAALPADPTVAPELQRLDRSLEQHLSMDHLFRVRAVLRRGPRALLDQLQAKMKELKALDLAPRVPAELKPPKRQQRATRKKRAVKRNKVRKNQAHLDRLGASAEGWVLAAVMQAIVALPADERSACMEQLMATVAAAYDGEAATAVLSYGRQAADDSRDDEERLEALAQFLHLSRESDEFGCDILGWLQPRGEDAARPIFLEVKSVSGKAFFMSANEWQRAGELRGDYAVCAVVRAKSGPDAPSHMTLLPDPVALEAHQLLELETDTWTVTMG